VEYGKVLQHYLNVQGITKYELAKRARCSRSQITEYINGASKEPTLSRGKAIADALGVPFEEMLRMMFEE
jgi:transcriptional regulator with XRE-family HTH domain